MKKKRKIFKGLIVCFLIIVPIISYRFWIYNSYQSHCDDNEILEQNLKVLGNTTTVTINKKEYNGDYLKQGNLKIPNQFKDYFLSNESLTEVTYTIPKKSLLSFGSLLSEVDNLKSISNLCVNCEKDIDRIIKENNLKTDVDVLNYIKDYKCTKNTFFTGIRKMKENFIISNYIELHIMSSYSKLVYITGDYNGYMYSSLQNNDNGQLLKYYVVLENNGKNYYINLVTRDNYSEQQMYDLISYVVIE